MQNFAAIGPFGAEIWRGGQIDPPPSKNLLSKSPVKIGLKLGDGEFTFIVVQELYTPVLIKKDIDLFYFTEIVTVL